MSIGTCLQTRPVLLEMVRAATLAPSADNNQPWRFSLDENRLLVFDDASRALPSDVDRMFDLTALGAAIENTCIAARHSGWDVSVEIASAGEQRGEQATSPVASIELLDESPGGGGDPLYDQLPRRCTCRRAFSTKPVPADVLSELSHSADAFPNVQIDWFTARADLKSLGRLVAATDALRFEHSRFHAELYKQLRFSQSEVLRTRDGLDVRTLELPLGGGLVLRLLRSWNLLKRLNRVGLSRALGRPSAQLVRRSGAVGILSVPRSGVAEFLDGGRALQRLWLTAQARGLALHPLGSLPIFLVQLHSAASPLSPGQLARVAVVAERFTRLAPASAGRIVQIAFRLGYAPPPAARSLRREADEVLLDNLPDERK